MAVSTVAGQWLLENDGLKHKRLAHWEKPKNPRTRLDAHLHNCAKRELTPREFVEANRGAKANDCIFVPHALPGRRVNVKYLDKTISAARYMALMTLGAPKHECIMVRHICGNGHLSCVNPGHLIWGDASENQSDAVKHRAAKTPQDKINAIYGKL